MYIHLTQKRVLINRVLINCSGRVDKKREKSQYLAWIGGLLAISPINDGNLQPPTFLAKIIIKMAENRGASMKSINAFVAHSFDPREDPLISQFLKFFDSLKDSMEFNWDHAEKAEAKAVSKKVMEKMENKNLLIGIITGKEYRIEANLLQDFWKWKCALKSRFKRGGSDWIIQESGYALAKGMVLLFLIEDGVDLTAGLQGDVEYIPFKRNNPPESFIKIVEVMGSIKREGKEIGSQVSLAPPPSKKADIEKETEQKILLEPRQENFSSSFRTLYKSIVIDRNLQDASKQLKEILVEFGEDESFPPIYWESLSSSFKVQAGYAEGLDELKELCAKNPDNSTPFVFIADSLKELKQYSQAAEQYLNLSKMEKGIESIRCVAKAAEAFALEDKSDLAIDLLLTEFSKALRIEETNYLYLQLANIFKIPKTNFLFDAFAEKALECFPLDNDLRFSLAYHYGESGSMASSLFHYDILREHRPDGSCLNNIGVAYGHLKMKNNAVQSYKEAIDKHQETLSMANLAGIHIDAGLLDEAECILEKTSGIKDYHKNVDFNRNRIKEVREEEDKEKTKTIEESKTERKFLIRFAEAYSFPQAISITGDWESRYGVITMKMEGKTISGQKEVEEVPLANALAGLMAIPAQSEKRRISLSGKLNNRGIEYQLSIEKLQPFKSLLGGGIIIFTGLMIISKDGQLMEVMEKDDSGKKKFYEMKKLG